ncbi:HNH endonuclease [Rhodococcus sp. BP-252]|nr:MULTISPECIES: HNH endonuclease [Rhodococcus]MBY6412112.1 HNH endonuclease [Rhodococcus sp. BP-320]MBY6416692.1 HNH endonuclease [Rhodococcus sp. BP-321]MBY6421119.1 HNH endonuclease [Rhodococcus sp. BP-324]MBY6426716.1 HNH endonuclease [Rhodococcus sp. BP-323]MBY6431715.1 HNH endonuclease [Rhodococcus sp. BP-322]
MKKKQHHRQLPPTDAYETADQRLRTSGANALHVVPPDGSAGHSHMAEDVVPAWVKRRVLLLNATFEPLTALPMRRAVVLLVCDKADVIHDDPEGPFIRSADFSVQVPSVIRLRTFVRVPYRARVPMTRAALMHRDRFRCAYCGGKAETVDHVVPRSRGGGHSWENCVACCAPCNHRKADKLLSELGWTLRAQLVPPKGPHWRLLASTKELDPSWLAYLGEGAA